MPLGLPLRLCDRAGRHLMLISSAFSLALPFSVVAKKVKADAY